MSKRNFGLLSAVILGAILGGWLLIAFGLPVLLPFLIGYLVARIAEPLVRRLANRRWMPRWVCAGLCVTVVFLLLVVVLYLLCRLLCGQLAGLLRELPALLQSVAGPLEWLQEQVLGLASRAPAEMQPMLRGWVEQLFAGSSMVLEKLSEGLFSTASAMLVGLPDLLLFLMTAILASFMISARLPWLHRTVKRLIPDKWHRKIQLFGERTKNALGGWVRAQIRLMGLTFLILTAGLLLLRIHYAILLAALITLIDALPVFGTGTVLIPWGLLCFLRQDPARGVGLLVLYGTAALTRSAMEPRLIGRQIGMNPLLTLLALYAGWQLCGVAGMILFPIGAILLQEFCELLGLWNFGRDSA